VPYWPPKSDVTGFRIGGRPGEQYQGFFIYRNDRLLQAGGWSDIAIPGPTRQLARVVLDDASAIGSFVTMNPEKQGLKFEPIFHDAVGHAVAADGATFDQFLTHAESVYVDSKRRNRSRKPAIAPDRGFAPTLRRIIGTELPMIVGESLRLQWRPMPEGEFSRRRLCRPSIVVKQSLSRFICSRRRQSQRCPHDESAVVSPNPPCI